MRLHNGKLFWPDTLKKKGIKESRSEISSHYDAVIIGGGMSGVLAAYTLLQQGLKIAVLDKRGMGEGSSSANTGLLQFSNDIMLHELIEQIGEEQAVRFYSLCKKAVDQLEETSRSVKRETDFIRRKSICYASSEAHAGKLKKEYDALTKHGFSADYWTGEEVREHLPFDKPAALVTYGDAEVNPYRFIHAIISYLEEEGVHLFEHVEAEGTEQKDDSILLHTSIGTFTASHLIYSVGYDLSAVKPKVGAAINRSYAIATEPIEDLSLWNDRALIWETNRPYLYMRTTADNRIVAGGLDEEKPEAPKDESWIENRAAEIEKELQQLFPQLPIKKAYEWGATFGESLDNLPFIGRHPEREKEYYLLGYGGNGTVYSMLGSHILCDLILGKENQDAELVKLDR
ncbi:FAD-binding oxidoreductase [Metabacillus sp. GX 13764]|uniref:NAD(P)/FAD-dependent oxidoreductase n=1 Tax=Metabacillus kandeliae TaxID=2900151 RepID=UPI001E34A8EC|nr:FAD-binding oxidoreductase [Metabacillus kandeliae]MCD7035251.1 FAD-binding oxidoreductase [Metabacillus kandeliae]